MTGVEGIPGDVLALKQEVAEAKNILARALGYQPYPDEPELRGPWPHADGSGDHTVITLAMEAERILAGHAVTAALAEVAPDLVEVEALRATIARVEALVADWRKLNGWPSSVAVPSLREALRGDES